MIDTLLALVPTYGVWLIMISVTLSCLALPVPSSMLVMAAGGFAASGDFAYWELFGFAFAGFLLGDQVAFHMARRAGSPLLTRLKAKPKVGRFIDRAEAIVERRGAFAVVLSRTIFSPIGPYVTYVSGAMRLGWAQFSVAAVFGAFLWSLGYSWLGYAFASRIDEIAAMISSSVGIVMAGAVAGGLCWWLVHRYRAEQVRVLA